MTTTRKLIVEVCNARNLMPKDGQGTSNPYVLVEFDGQRSRTSTKAKDLNPQWDEKLEFVVNNPELMSAQLLAVNVFNDNNNGGRSNFLGRLKVCGSSFVKQGEEALVYYPLEKRSIFSHIKGEIGLKIYYLDEEETKVDEPEKKPKEVDLSPQKEEVQSPPAEEKKAEEKDKPKGDDSPIENKSTEDQLPPMESDKSVNMEESKIEVSDPLPNISPSPPLDFSIKDFSSSIGAINGDRISRYDLVEQMQYLYVRVIRARELAAKDMNGSSDRYVMLTIGSHKVRTRAVRNNLNPEWDEVFAIGKDKLNASTLEVTVWDEDVGKKDDFLGTVSFDLQEVPTRVPPDSPLAPQWYRLEETSGTMFGDDGRNVKGDIMLAVWLGTQADEAFSQAWQSDTGGLMLHTRSKVYLSPKLWYLRVNIIEAHDLRPIEKIIYSEVSVKAQLGFQVFKTRFCKGTATPIWNEDLVFVCAEPFEESLVLSVEQRTNGSNKEEIIIGETMIFLSKVEKRVDHRIVGSVWFNLEKKDKDGDSKEKLYNGRIHVRLCFDGGYHVSDEAAHVSSDVKPTAKQLWKPPLGVLEIGIISAKNLMPMKTKDGRGSTDAFCVAKYGQKWVRTRTVLDSFNPKWNEQYTWEVHDHCTVFTLGVFDNSQLNANEDVKSSNPNPPKDQRIGKVRIRISTLESERIYTNSYPLLLLQPSGVKKMGEIELAVRFSCSSLTDILHVYSLPMLPKMHYLHPFGIGQQDLLRHAAMKIVVSRLGRSEPPLSQDVVQYILDTEANLWSMRRSKANWYRLVNVLSGLMAVSKWVEDICQWKNPTTTMLVQALFLILVWYPELILPTVFVYMSLIGAWRYRWRPRMPPHMDTLLSHADGGSVDSDELNEEFDTFPTSCSPEIMRMRYDRLRSVASRIQTVLGDLATQGERFQALLSWRDPRATAFFLIFCLVASLVLYATPFRVIAVLFGFYFLRHPRYRDPLPSAPLNFFRRLPALSDRML